jgi:hypothetical protein
LNTFVKSLLVCILKQVGWLWQRRELSFSAFRLVKLVL